MDPDLAGLAAAEGFVLEIVLDAVREFSSRVHCGLRGRRRDCLLFGTADEQGCG